MDPDTGRVEHFGASDGLPAGRVLRVYRDRRGTLWFSTINGLARFQPFPRRTTPPIVLLTGLSVAGQARPVSVVGETNLDLPELDYASSPVEISFVGLGQPGERLRYQYRLEGATGGWSPLSTRRNVSYASLAPGRYRFAVRAVTTDGIESAHAATVSFVVHPPFWRAGWFLLLVVASVAGGGYALHRYRLFRLLELERMRTRISTDLHDEVGANLTRIAILSEVAERTADSGHTLPGVSSIGNIARESLSALNDIVWSLNPRSDTLQAIAHKLRHHAQEACDGERVALTLDFDELDERVTVAPDLRQDVYLIIKEAVNNAVRHAKSRHLAISLRVEAGGVLIAVHDDGIGFDPALARDGVGLGSMRRRAERVGADLRIESAPGHGTRIMLSVPLGRSGSG